MTGKDFAEMIEYAFGTDETKGEPGCETVTVVFNTIRGNGGYASSQSRITVERAGIIMKDGYVHFYTQEDTNPFDTGKQKWIAFMVPYENIKMVCF